MAKAPKTAHTSGAKMGMGDFYGTGKKNPIGKVKEGMGIKASTVKGLNKPPKTLA
jgi:hypothetical protein